MKNLLEVCCGNLDSVRAAVEGGAPRVELCRALELDGLTPDWEDLREARRLFPQLTIHVLIRPRAGDFCYTPREVEAMSGDIEAALDCGADGIVIGCLTPSGDVDVPAMRVLMEAADGRPVTFHRAFDLCREPFSALEDIIGLGCRRILTSGQAPTVAEGTELIRELRHRAGGRIGLLPGCGVTPENARRILQLTACDEIHASASAAGPDGRKVTSARSVSAIIQAINSTVMYTFTPVKDQAGKFVLSLDNRVSIVEAITAFCLEKGILAGEITGLGAVNLATFRFLDPVTLKYVDKTFEEQMEITNLTGNISQKDGKPYLHLHITASRSDYSCIGGHLLDARINGACELFVTSFPGTFVGRRPDPETGVNLYSF